MCFRKKYIVLIVAALGACSPVKNMTKRGHLNSVSLLLPDYEPITEEIIDSTQREDPVPGCPFILNAVKDKTTGEMVATDVITASKVVSRFRNIAERAGLVSVEFDIIIPEEVVSSSHQLRFYPKAYFLKDSTVFEPIYITGERYRMHQLRAYRRFEDYKSSIITDSSAFVKTRPLEIFFGRNRFIQNNREIIEHYTLNGKKSRHQRKWSNLRSKYKEYVKDPIKTVGIRLDTIVKNGDGSIIYRYLQTMPHRRGLKKMDLTLDGGLFKNGDHLASISSKDTLTFYVSTLTSIVMEPSTDMPDEYNRAIEDIKNFHYKRAIETLQKYKDYNTALAYALADYNAHSLSILKALPDNDKVLYLRALIRARLGDFYLALKDLRASISLNPSLRHRANLDPELSSLTKKL